MNILWYISWCILLISAITGLTFTTIRHKRYSKMQEKTYASYTEYKRTMHKFIMNDIDSPNYTLICEVIALFSTIGIIVSLHMQAVNNVINFNNILIEILISLCGTTFISFILYVREERPKIKKILKIVTISFGLTVTLLVVAIIIARIIGII